MALCIAATITCVTTALVIPALAFVIPAQAGIQRDSAILDPAEVVAAYLAARHWIDELAPPMPGDAAASLPLTNATGVCILLRRSGRVVGTGTAPQRANLDRSLLVRTAVGRALGEAMRDPAIAGLPEDMRQEVGRLLTVELEVAGPTEPLLGRSIDAITRQIEPGLDGIALRRGDSWAMLFPSQLRATNSEANTHMRLPALAGTLGVSLPPMRTERGDADIAAVLREHRLTAHRFRTMHLAQTAPERPPFETFRGDIVIAQHEVNDSRIATFADCIARHTLASLWPGTSGAAVAADHPMRDAAFGIMSDYRPVADGYRGMGIAPPMEQALTALALARYAHSPGVDPTLRESAAEASQKLLRDLATVEPTEDDPLRDPAASAAIVYAMAEIEVRNEAVEVMHSRALQTLADVRDASPHVLAMIAGAKARHVLRTNAMTSDIRTAIDRAWESAQEHHRIALLPWIAWAELDYATATGQPIANADELRRMRGMLDALRIRDEAQPDLHGGFALPRADSQSTRPAAFLAAMLANENLTTNEELLSAMAAQMMVMRFLMQLSVRDTSAWSLRNPARAIGGIRNAPWDSDMPRAAQAMALIAAVDTLAAFERRRD